MGREANDERETGDPVASKAWLAHLAHDLRGPLSPLAMAVSLLQTGRAGPAQQPELYALMQRQIECLTQLLDDTADLLVLRPRAAQAVDLASLLDMFAIKSARRLRAAGAMLDVAVPSAPVLVAGDMRDLLRLLGELALRGADAGGRGSTLQLAIAGDGEAPCLSLRLLAVELPSDVAARCEQVVAVLTAVSQTHVADAMSATVLRRYGITLAADADSPGFVLRFQPA